MAASIDVLTLTYQASADLSANSFLAAKFSTGQVAVQTSAGAAVVGVIQENPPDAQGEAVRVRKLGTSKIRVDGTTPIAFGDYLKTDTSGRGVKASSGDVVFAVAEGASSAANDVIEGMLLPQGAKMP